MENCYFLCLKITFPELSLPNCSNVMIRVINVCLWFLVWQVQGGGNTGNTMTCAARLGLKPRIISKVSCLLDVSLW